MAKKDKEKQNKLLTNLCQSAITKPSHSDTDRGAVANSNLQRGHPVKQAKGKTAEIGTEASVQGWYNG